MHGIYRFSALLLIISVFWALSAFCEVPVIWQKDGISLRQGHHIEWQRAGTSDQFQNVVYVWSDTRFGDRDVFAQKYDQYGNTQWAEGGAIVCHGPIRQEDPDMCSDLQGGFIITWVDFRDDTSGDVYAQRIDTNGDIMWDSLGVPLCTIPFSEQMTLHTISDEAGGAIVIWHDTRWGDEGDLYAQHIMADGTVDPIWQVDGNIVAQATGNQGGPGAQTVDADGEGGVIVAWIDERVPGDPNVYVQRITIDGTLAWGDISGMAICVDTTEQVGVKLAPDGNGGAFIVWVDKRNYSATREDIYLQRVDHDGVVQYQTDGIPLVVQPNKQELPRIVYDGMGGANIVWEDYRTINLVSDIYAQRIDGSGQKSWGDDDLLICDAAENQRGVRLSSGGDGSVVIAWSDDRYGASPRSDLYAQRVEADGTIAWEVGGIVVSDAPYLQEDPLVRNLENGSVFIVWKDGREGSPGIYHQLLDENGIPQLTVGGEIVVWGLEGDAAWPRVIKLDNSGYMRMMMIWQDQRYVYIGNFIYMQMLGLDGSIAFPVNGNPIAIEYSQIDTLGDQINPEMVSDDAGGAIVCWEDYRMINWSIPQIYAQRVDFDGNSLWDSSGVILYTTGLNQTFPKICSDDNNGAFIAWSGWNMYWRNKSHIVKVDFSGNASAAKTFTTDSSEETVYGIGPDGVGGAIVYWRGGSFATDYNIYAARVDANVDTLWVRPIVIAPDNQTHIVGASNSQGGMVFVWSDKRDSIDFDIYAQWLDANGEQQWNSEGVLVVDEPFDQIPTDLVQDSEGNFLMVWNDTRNSLNNDVYLQKLSGLSGSPMFQAGGVPVCVNSEGDQWEADIIIDSTNGIKACWEANNPQIGSEIFASHFGSDGDLLPGWNENGDTVCAAFHNQINPVITDDFYDGVIAVWEDARSSGKEVKLNIFAQRWNSNPNVFVRPKNDNQPKKFSLAQNYPNPFNPATKILFTIKEAGHVKLMIYNALGEEVTTLKDGYFDIGSYKAVWKGDDSSGMMVATGIYYYRLEFNGQMKVMKMIMLK